MTIHIAPYDGGSPPNGIELLTRGSYGPVENFLMAKMVNGLLVTWTFDDTGSFVETHEEQKGLQRWLDILT